MFGAPGHVYVYLIYGMYHCLNIVTEEPGIASAVLIRGLKLPDIYLDGPGKICRHLGINKTHNNLNLVTNQVVYLTEGINPKHYMTTTRIGIKKAIDKPWRFLIPTNEIYSF